MNYLLDEKEYSELKANQVNGEHVEKLENAAIEFVNNEGCNAETFQYCEDCPYAGMAHSKLAFPYCIAGKYRSWPK